MANTQLDNHEAKLCGHCNKGIKYKQGNEKDGYVWYCYVCGDMEYHSFN